MKPNNKYQRLLKTTGIYAIGSIGSKAIIYFLVPFYTNILTTEEYGTADLVFTFSQLMIPMLSIAIYNGVRRYGLSKESSPNEALSQGITIWICTCIVSVLVTPMFSFYSPISPWKWYLCLHVDFSTLHLILNSYLQTIGKNKEFAIANILHSLFLALLNILFLTVLNMGVSGFLLANIIAVVLVDVIIICVTKINPFGLFKLFNKQLAKKMIVYSAPIILNDISWWVIHSSDKIMIENMVGADSLGLYSVAAKIPSMISVLISIISQAWGISSIIEVESTNDNTFYKDVFDLYAILGFSGSIFLVSIMKFFMKIYVGAEFYIAWQFAPVLIASASFTAISSYCGSVYAAIKKNMNSMWSTLFAAIINVIVNFVGISLWGVWGALLGTISSCFFVAIVRLVDVCRYINMRINIVRFIMNCSIVIVQAVLVSLDYHVVIISIISMALFIILNYKDANRIRCRFTQKSICSNKE